MSKLSPHLQVAIIVQARMGASRLPGKPLLEVLGRPLLFYLIERLKRCRLVDRIILATTNSIKDDAIYDWAKKECVECVRGDEEDVLSRYVLAAKKADAEIIVRITADCPLIDPEIIDTLVSLFISKYPSIDYLSNTLVRTFPRGLDVEVFSKKTLLEAAEKAQSSDEKEHVTFFIYRHPELFKIENFCYKKDESHYRMTVDTKEDFLLIQKILETLYPQNPEFGFQDLLTLMHEHPSWVKINQHIEQKLL